MMHGFFISLAKFAMQLAYGVLQLSNAYRRRWRRDMLLALRNLHAVHWGVLRGKPHEKAEPPLNIDGYARENIRVLTDILKKASIEFYWVPGEATSSTSTRLAIDITRAADFFDAVPRAAADGPLYCTHGDALATVNWVASRVPFKRIHARHNEIRSWKFFVGYGSEAMDEMSRLACCGVEFFESIDGQYRLFLVNDVSRWISAGEPRDEIEKYGVRLPTWRVMKETQVLGHCDFDVDLVYTWVDGSDRQWQEQKRHYQTLAGEHHPEAFDDGRFANRAELKYSLRSIAYYANFFRHVYVVTNGQVPAWLNHENPRITIVRHEEIFRFPEESLPVFNSHAIESVLHRIPNLAEHFVYMNDDIMFCRPIAKSQLFTFLGYPYVFLNRLNNYGLVQPTTAETPYINAGRNTLKLVQEKFGLVPWGTVRHAPHAQLKSTIIEIEGEHYERLVETERHKFRAMDDISLPSSLALIWGLASGKAVAAEIGSVTITLSAGLDMPLAMLRLLVFRDKDTVCLNECTQAEKTVQKTIDRDVVWFMERLLPLKSEFEKE